MTMEDMEKLLGRLAAKELFHFLSIQFGCSPSDVLYLISTFLKLPFAFDMLKITGEGVFFFPNRTFNSVRKGVG